MKFKIMPPAILFACLLLSILSHFFFPIKRIIHPPYSYLGLLALIAGIILNITSDNLFKKKKMPIKPHDKPTQLETSGPYGLSRHPMYLGMALILCGLFLLLGSIVTMIFLIIFIFIMNSVFMPFEEDSLERAFGKDYLHYKERVRRWI